MPRPRRRSSVRPATLRGVVALACGALLAATAACGSSEDPTAAEQLADRATKGLTASYTAGYTLSQTGASASATPSPSASPSAGAPAVGSGLVLVARTPDSLRLDVTTSTGTATSIRTPEGTIACQSPTGGKTPTCLTVAAAGATPPAAFDPGLRRLFDDTLRALSEQTDQYVVTEADGINAAGVDAACFTVAAADGATDPSVDPGTYCLSEDGVPVVATFASGTATATTLRNETVGPETFQPPAKPTPLPTG